jgi:hypothetical protein
MHAEIAGVYRVDAAEPVHLIELVVEGGDDFDFGGVTQEDPKQPRSNWQVAYDERIINESERGLRYAFFFHHLDLDKPLITPAGTLVMPMPTEMPARLKDITYEAP